MSRVSTVSCLCTLLLFSFSLSGCGDPRGKSQIQMNKLQLALYEYAQAHDSEWPDSLEQIKESVGGDDAYQKLITNPVTGDNPGYEYIKPKGRPGDDNYEHRQLILYQLNKGKRDQNLKAGYSDGSFK